MIIQDIALFKSFIERETLREIYIRGYRKSISFTKNPSSIEYFLSNVEPEQAIKKAIQKYSLNETFGFDFWENTNENWIIFLKKGRDRHSYNDHQQLIELEGMFKVLRENWDAVKAWLYEDVDKALTRLGLMQDETKEFSQKELTKKVDDLPDIDNFEGVPEAEDELEFFELSVGRRSNRLKDGQVSLNFRNKSYKLTVNQKDTNRIKERDFKYARLARNKQGDIIIQYYKTEIPNQRQINITYSSRIGGSYVSVVINSKDLCEKLKTLLNLSGDYFILNVEELLIDSDKANYKISK